ncbi:MAG: caspase family protein [Planctomycetia bacterium]|nr:caspase family protein [Planctomycetia bacterium]
MSYVALLIALEDYADRLLLPVPFAASDLAAFSNTLKAIGFKEADQVCRFNAQATKSGIESDVRKLARRLTNADTLFLFYVGHGFSLAGTNYLTCFDTRPDDLAETSVSISALTDTLKSCDCRSICLFLDAAHHGSSGESEMSTCPAPLDEPRLEASLAKLDRVVCFTSCRSGEESHSSAHRKQGIWTQHVLAALTGDAATAISERRLVTAASLQRYLSQAVPRTLRADFATPVRQTPWLYGDISDDFVVADLNSVLDRKRLEATPAVPRLDAVVLSAAKTQPVKHLPGFKKSHRLPDSKTSNADTFIASITAATLQSDLEATFLTLKSAYQFKRLEIEKRGPADGSGVIATPFFEYSVSVELDADDPTQVIWNRAISKISDPTQVFCEAFDRVFASVFDTIEISTGEPIDVTAVIDRIEQFDGHEFAATYDSDCSVCFVRVVGITTLIRITSRGVFITDQRANSPTALLNSAMLIQSKLTNELGLKSFSAT